MLDVDCVDAHYGMHAALRGASLQVKTGEVVSVLGANGGGKSTLLKVIAGLLPAGPRSDIRFNGLSLVGVPPELRVELGIALVPEGRGIFGELTVRENLFLGAYPKRARPREKQTLDLVLKLFPKLRERLGQTARTMSGGEQQMVAIGRALMSNPELLMLDEPSLGLSPLMVSELFKALEQVRRTKVAILIVEQNAKKSLGMSDRGYLLEQGRMVGEGASAELLESELVRKAYLGGP